MNTTLNKTQIENVLKGKLNEEILDIPFIIMRDSIRLIKTEHVSWEYLLVYSNEISRTEGPKKAVEIDRKTAMGLIKKFSMQKVMSQKGGQIWEKPGCPFKAKYPKHKMCYN